MHSVYYKQAARRAVAARQHGLLRLGRAWPAAGILAAALVWTGLGLASAQAGPNAQIVIIAPPTQSTHIDSNRQIQVLGPDGRVIYDEHREYLGYPPGYGSGYSNRGYGYPGNSGYYGYPQRRAGVTAPTVSGGYGSPRAPYYGGYPARPHHPANNGHGRPGYPPRHSQSQQPQSYRQEHDYSYSGRRGVTTERAYIPSQRATLDR